MLCLNIGMKLRELKSLKYMEYNKAKIWHKRLYHMYRDVIFG